MKGNETPYIGSKDMNITDGFTKNSALKKNKELENTWSRFDMFFLKPEKHKIIVQLDGHMCGAWCVAEIFNFHNGLLDQEQLIGKQIELMEVEIRKRMCSFSIDYMKAYLLLHKNDKVYDDILDLRHSQSFSSVHTDTPKTVPLTQESEVPTYAIENTKLINDDKKDATSDTTSQGKDIVHTTVTPTKLMSTPGNTSPKSIHSPDENEAATTMIGFMNIKTSPITKKQDSSDTTCYQSVDHICASTDTCAWCTNFFPNNTTTSNYCTIGYSTQYLDQGVFANDHIPSKTVICEYFGSIVQAAPGGFHDASLGDGTYIDASSDDSIGKNINHACEPNCKLSKVMVNGKNDDDDETKLFIVAIKDIAKGQELTYHYNHGNNDDSLLEVLQAGYCNCIICKSIDKNPRKRKEPSVTNAVSSSTRGKRVLKKRLPNRNDMSGKVPRSRTSLPLAKAVLYDYGIMDDKAKDDEFIVNHYSLLEKLTSKYPTIEDFDISRKLEDQDYDYEDNDRLTEQQHHTRSSSGVTSDPSSCIKVSREDENNPAIVKKIYDAILDIVSRSFCPVNGTSMKDLFHFVEKLLMKYKVYVCEKSIDLNRRNQSKTIFRVVGFVIVEEHFKFDDGGKDNGIIVHLLATVPEARSTCVATLLLQRISKVRSKKMKNYPVIAVMYPNVMLPLRLVAKNVIDAAVKNFHVKKKSLRAGRNIERYNKESSVQFFVDHMQFLYWDHFEKKITSIHDMKDCLVLYAEAVNIRNVGVKGHNYTRFIDLRMETSSSLQMVIPRAVVDKNVMSKGRDTFTLKVQSVLMGWVNLVQMSTDELKDIMIKSKHMQNEDDIDLTNLHDMLDVIWTACGLNKALKTKFVSGMKLSVNGGKQLGDNLVGSVEKVAGDGYKDETSDMITTDEVVSVTSQDRDTEMVDIEFYYYNKFRNHPELLKIPVTMSQKKDPTTTMACSFLSCVLLVHTIDKNLSSDILEYVKSEKQLDINNMKLFKASGDQPSVNSLLNMWSLHLRKAGFESVNTVACPSPGRSGLYLCSVSNTVGLRHGVGIDYDRKMIWDPSEKEALPLTSTFFLDLSQHVHPDEENSIKMFELNSNMGYRKNTPYKKYIGTKMPMLKTSKIGEVIAMKKMEDSAKRMFVMMISEDGMDLEEVDGRLLKEMIGNKDKK